MFSLRGFDRRSNAAVDVIIQPARGDAGGKCVFLRTSEIVGLGAGCLIPDVLRLFEEKSCSEVSGLFPP